MGWQKNTGYLLIILFFLIPALAFGQNNDPGTKAVRDSLSKDSVHHRTDSTRKDSVKKANDSTHYTDAIKFKYSYTGTGNINNTNTVHSYLLSNAVSFSAIKKRGALNINNTWVYGSQQGTLTNNDYNASIDFSLYKTIRHFYYWGLVNYNTSLSLQVHHLIQAGLGPGYYLLDKKKASINISDGILYEQGDLQDILYGSPQGDITQRDIYHVFRNSLRIKYRFAIGDRITFDGIELIQHSLVTIHNYILNLTANSSVRLNKWLNVTAAFAFNKFTRTRSENTLVTFGVTIVR